MVGQSDIEPERNCIHAIVAVHEIVIGVLLLFKIHEYSILEDQKSSRLSQKNHDKNY